MYRYLGISRERCVQPVLMGSTALRSSVGKHPRHGFSTEAGHSLYPLQPGSPGMCCAFTAQFHPKTVQHFQNNNL